MKKEQGAMAISRLGRNWKFITLLACLGIINLGGIYIFSESSAGRTARCDLSADKDKRNTDECELRDY